MTYQHTTTTTIPQNRRQISLSFHSTTPKGVETVGEYFLLFVHDCGVVAGADEAAWAAKYDDMRWGRIQLVLMCAHARAEHQVVMR